MNFIYAYISVENTPETIKLLPTVLVSARMDFFLHSVCCDAMLLMLGKKTMLITHQFLYFADK